MVHEYDSIDSQDLTLDGFLDTLDVAATIEEHIGVVAQDQYESGEKREELRDMLFERAQKRGDEVTLERCDRAIDNYFAEQYMFQAPEETFSTKAAYMYADRVKLGLKWVVAPLLGLSLLAGSVSGVRGLHSAYLNTQEEKVERGVRAAYEERQELFIDTERLLSSPTLLDLPEHEKQQLERTVTGAQQDLVALDSFFDAYCSDGSSHDDVTRENFRDVRNLLSSTDEKLEGIAGDIDNGRQIITTQEGLVATKGKLESLMGEIQGIDSHTLFQQRAQAAYDSGMTDIGDRDLEGAVSSQHALLGIKSDMSKYTSLVSESRSLYESILDVAKVNEARGKGESLYDDATRFINSADVSNLSRTVSELTSLNETLHQEYTLRIVSRPGVKSGFRRDYRETKKVSGYYVVVEAIDSSGRAMAMPITNEENDRTNTVVMWGELVSESTYERVKRDKQSDGIIDNDEFGIKRKGHLYEEITMPGVIKRRQVTEW